MNKNGRSLREFQSMLFPTVVHSIYESNSLIMEELGYNRSAISVQHVQLYGNINREQKAVYDDVVNFVLSGKGGFFFVCGSGGTTKTFLWRTICARLILLGKIVLIVASSGIADLLLEGGRITHSRFKIPIRLDKDSICLVDQGSQ